MLVPCSEPASSIRANIITVRCSLIAYLGHPGGYEHYGLFVVHNQLPKWVRTLSLFVVRCLICLFVACVTCLWLGCVMCLFLVCVLFLFLVCVMCLCTLASLRSAGARFARCGRSAAAGHNSEHYCVRCSWLNVRERQCPSPIEIFSEPVLVEIRPTLCGKDF